MKDRNTTSQDELTDYLNNCEKLEEIKKQEIPDEIDITIDGIQYEDVKQGREMMIQKILNDSDYSYTKEEATKIVDNIIDKGMDFNKAREEIDNEKAREESDSQREKEDDEGREKTPWDDAMRRRGF